MAISVVLIYLMVIPLTNGAAKHTCIKVLVNRNREKRAMIELILSALLHMTL